MDEDIDLDDIRAFIKTLEEGLDEHKDHISDADRFAVIKAITCMKMVETKKMEELHII